MSRIYFGIITQNNEKNIDELTSNICSYIDGIFAVDHYSTDNTYKILQERKGTGEITQIPFFQNHSWAMNGFLLNPKLRPGDWVLLRDSAERLSLEFLKILRNFVNDLEKNDINSVFHYSKLLLFKKFEHQIFLSSPHWGLNRPQEKYSAFEQIFPKDHEKYAYSIRNKRPDDHFIDHFGKYFFYDSSNHMLLGRENDMEDFHKHERHRQQFKKYCEDHLKIPLTVDGLKNYLLNNPLTQTLKASLNFEQILNDIYCYHVLKHPLEDIKKRHETKELFKIT